LIHNGLSTIRIIETFLRARLALIARKTLMRLLLNAADYLHAFVDIVTRCSNCVPFSCWSANRKNNAVN